MSKTARRLRAERARRARAARLRAAERRRLVACRKRAVKAGKSGAACTKKPTTQKRPTKPKGAPAAPASPALGPRPEPTAPSVVTATPPVPAGPAAPSPAQPVPAPAVPVAVAVPAPPATTPPPPPPVPAPTTTTAPVTKTPWGDVRFGRAEATRLLWRAGFGPRPGDVDRLLALGLHGAIDALLDPPAAALTGPEPRDGLGQPLKPGATWGHDQLWWLDRMVRSNQPLIERMTLVWHDWFATSIFKVVHSDQMLQQNATFRNGALGSFPDLLARITRDPAMLVYLDGYASNRWAVNENYGREVMELFTLGAGRGAYTEQDVREISRAFTGLRYEKTADGTWRSWHEPAWHDPDPKTIFGRTGRFDDRDACRLLVEHDLHPSFLVSKLWASFIPTAPDAATVAELSRIYVANDRTIAPVLRGILSHPHLHHGQAMIKPPAVHLAGMLRAVGRGIDVDHWPWLLQQAGQMLFAPPNVSGWDDTRWMNSATWKARATACAVVLEPLQIVSWAADLVDVPTETSSQAVDRALAFWGNPPVSPDVREALVLHARDAALTPTALLHPKPGRGMRQNSLRMLIGTSSDAHTS